MLGVTASVVLAVPGAAWGAVWLDQSQTQTNGGWYVQYDYNGYNQYYAQTFTPGSTAWLDRVELMFSPGDPFPTRVAYTASLWITEVQAGGAPYDPEDPGNGDKVLGLGTLYIPADFPEESWLSVAYSPGEVFLGQGTEYAMVLGTDHRMVEFTDTACSHSQWYTNPYAGGELWYKRVGYDWNDDAVGNGPSDFCFKTYMNDTAPGLPAFALLGAAPVVRGLIRRLRRR